MAGKPLALTARQVEALCRGAAKVGYVPVLEIGGVVVYLIPKSDLPPSVLTGTPIDPLDAEFAAYEAKYGDGGNSNKIRS